MFLWLVQLSSKDFSVMKSFFCYFIILVFLFANFLQCKGVKDTCRTLIYLPIINLELISDDQFKQAVCSLRDFRYVSSLTCHQDCLNEKIAKIEGGPEALEQCWENLAGQQPPQGQREIVKFFCQHHNAWILKNIADHCVLSNVTRGFTNRYLLRDLSRCPGISLFARKFASPRALEVTPRTYEHVRREKDIFSPLMTMLEANEKIHRICILNDAKLLEKQMIENECFLASHPDKREEIFDCWEKMTNTTYPRSKTDWWTFMCHQEDPFGIREGFEFCLMNRYGLNKHDKCDQFHILQPSYHIFRPTLPEPSVQKYIQLYESHLEIKRTGSSSKMQGHPLCRDVWRTTDDGSTRLKYTSMVKRFLKTTPAICLASSATEEYSDLIDGCFDFYVPEFRKMRQNLKSDSVRSFSDTEWIRFACDLEDPEEVFSSVRKCIKISVLRANEWMKSTRLLGRFRRGQTRGTPAASFIQAFKTCFK